MIKQIEGNWGQSNINAFQKKNSVTDFKSAHLSGQLVGQTANQPPPPSPGMTRIASSGGKYVGCDMKAYMVK